MKGSKWNIHTYINDSILNDNIHGLKIIITQAYIKIIIKSSNYPFTTFFPFK